MRMYCRRTSLFLVLFLGLGLVAMTACSRKPKPALTPVSQPPQTSTETTPPPPPKVETPPAVVQDLADVLFDYDRFALRDDARETLNTDGKMLVADERTNVLLEGHCDERGTVEYNLALGERRANSVKAYLVQYGVDPGRLSTISYGEERPFALGTGEEVWAQNRRVHFVKQ